MLQCIPTQTNGQGCFLPHIIGQHQYSFCHVMFRSRLFSLTEEYSNCSYHLRQRVSCHAYSRSEDRLLYLFVGVISSPIRHCPASINGNECGQKLCALLQPMLPSNGNIAATSKVNPLSSGTYPNDTPPMCSPSTGHMAGWYVQSWIGVIHITWLDQE